MLRIISDIPKDSFHKNLKLKNIIHKKSKVLLILNDSGRLGFLDSLIIKELKIIEPWFTEIILITNAETTGWKRYSSLFNIKSFPYHALFERGTLTSEGDDLKSLQNFLKTFH